MKRAVRRGVASCLVHFCSLTLSGRAHAGVIQVYWRQAARRTAKNLVKVVKTVFILVIGSLVFVFSCSLLTDTGEFDEHLTNVLSQSVTSKSASSVSFLTRGGWGNSCGTFSRAEVNRADSVVFVKVYGKQPKDATCLTVMTSFLAPVTINLPSRSTYTFKFWSSDSTSIDTTFAI